MTVNLIFIASSYNLHSILDQQQLPRSEQMARITMNRNNQVHDYLMKSARYIVNYCLNHAIGTIVVGYNPDWKRDANMGQRNNQNFVQIPAWATAPSTRKPLWALRIAMH